MAEPRKGNMITERLTLRELRLVQIHRAMPGYYQRRMAQAGVTYLRLFRERQKPGYVDPWVHFNGELKNSPPRCSTVIHSHPTSCTKKHEMNKK
jgi:hypothetical protein